MGRTPCCSKVGLHRGQWTAREDALLTSYILNHGEGDWRSLPRKADLLRCGKSCRLRWMNYLRPDIKRGNISPEEEDLIIRLHILLGNRWSLIAGRLPGRTDNEIKNYWNSHLSKKLKKQGFVIKEGTPRSKRSGAPNSLKVKRSKKCSSENKSTEIKQCVDESECFKIYVPKPTRFKPRWPAMAKNESAETTEAVNGASGDSCDTNDVDLISSSLDSRHREFDRIIEFSDHVYVEHLGMGHAFPIQIDASLERLYREYSQLL